MTHQFICNGNEPVVSTKAGKLRGFVVDGTYTFHGIKYADAKRFQAPSEVEPWEGIRTALAYGYVCPLMSQDNPSNELLVPHRYWPQDENCQYLNVWTQTLEAGAKKPVLVWLHGGGFAAGSSIEQVAYDGENMSRYGDAVVVSINHRLNILGYLDLSPFGEKYANSGNAGSADMVAALRWIHDNIEAFGGDPENVTLFGQSGGGMKVWTLMQTPEADGLFQKGIVQSGLIDGFMEQEGDGTEIGKALLEELGLAERDVEKLETIPYPALVEAYQKAAAKVAQGNPGHYTGGNPMANEFYLGDPRQVGFCGHAKTIPVMIGTVFGEFAFGPGVAGRSTMGEEEMLEVVREKYGDGSDKLIQLFRAAYPGKNLTDLTVLDSLFRLPSIDFIAKKAVHQEAPTYSYLFAYEFPFDEGKPAWHCSEIPFVFHNTDKVPVCCIPGVSEKLEDRVFGAWIHFARYGNPGYSGLPDWPACKEGDEATMIFDRECEVRHNFDHELIELHQKLAPKFSFGSVKIEH